MKPEESEVQGHFFLQSKGHARSIRDNNNDDNDDIDDIDVNNNRRRRRTTK